MTSKEELYRRLGITIGLQRVEPDNDDADRGHISIGQADLDAANAEFEADPDAFIAKYAPGSLESFRRSRADAEAKLERIVDMTIPASGPGTVSHVCERAYFLNCVLTLPFGVVVQPSRWSMDPANSTDDGQYIGDQSMIAVLVGNEEVALIHPDQDDMSLSTQACEIVGIAAKAYEIGMGRGLQQGTNDVRQGILKALGL